MCYLVISDSLSAKRFIKAQGVGRKHFSTVSVKNDDYEYKSNQELTEELKQLSTSVDVKCVFIDETHSVDVNEVKKIFGKIKVSTHAVNSMMQEFIPVHKVFAH